MPESKEENSYKRYLLKRNIDILKNKKGFHTALISLTIPPSRKPHEIITYLKNEISESSNIKSKTNKKNVMDSINALISRLRLIKTIPENGLVMYSGQVPEDGKPGTERQEMYIIEPPEPITTFKYYCASDFLLEPLLDMVKEKGAYGIINIENKEAAVGWIRGSKLVITKTFTSGIHSKHNAGGQSQRRLERLIEEGAQNFYKRVGEYVNDTFMNIDDLEGFYVSGAGMSKEKFINKEVLDYRLRDKFIDFVDVSYSGEAGVRETVIKIQDDLKNLRYIKEKKWWDRFMRSVVKDDDMTSYGEKAVRRALSMGAVDMLLLSEKLDKISAHVKCEKCGHTTFKVIDPKQIGNFEEEIRMTQCPECSSNQYSVVETVDIVEDLGKIASEQGTTVEVLSTDTEEGTTLYATFGGIAAILRFRI